MSGTESFPFPIFVMRLDLYLKVSRLIKSRSVAQEFCTKGLVQVNGLAARSSKEVKAGDQIMIRRRNRITEYSIESIPVQKQVSKEVAPGLYRVVSEKELADD